MEADPQFELILKNGWLQGSIVRQELAIAAGLPFEEGKNQAYIVVSHSCDLTNPRPDLEPTIEVVRAEITSSRVSDYEFARSPRQIALTANRSGNERFLIVQIKARQFVDRKLLVSSTPDPDLRLPDDQVEMLAIWMSRRYWRPQLPTALVNRFGKKFDKLKKLCRQNRTVFTRILVSLNSWSELDEGEEYKIKVLGLLPAEITVSDEAKQWASAIDSILETIPNGVKSENTQVVSASRLSWATRSAFHPIDFDFLSYAAGERDLTPDS